MIHLIRSGLEYGVRRLGLDTIFTITEASDGLHTLALSAPFAQAVRSSGSQALSGGSNVIVYTVEDYDPFAALNIATGVFTAPRAGFYSVVFNAIVTAASGLVVSNSCDIAINGAFTGACLGALNGPTEQYFQVTRAGYVPAAGQIYSRININGGTSPVVIASRMTVVYVPGT